MKLYEATNATVTAVTSGSINTLDCSGYITVSSATVSGASYYFDSTAKKLYRKIAQVGTTVYVKEVKPSSNAVVKYVDGSATKIATFTYQPASGSWN